MGDQHPQAARGQTSPAAVQVAKVDPLKRKIGLDRVTVITDQSDEAGEFPESIPAASEIASESSCKPRPVRFMPRTTAH